MTPRGWYSCNIASCGIDFADKVFDSPFRALKDVPGAPHLDTWVDTKPEALEISRKNATKDLSIGIFQVGPKFLLVRTSSSELGHEPNIQLRGTTM
jgi:hypothetical protein